MKSPTISRAAFIHVMKTAGTFVDRYLTECVFLPRGGRTFNSWVSLGRDWTLDELVGIRQQQHQDAYVHNHAGGWDEETVRRFQDSGWFVFSFVRHPGDRWCSFYHWAPGKEAAQEMTLDAFLGRGLSGGFPRVSRDLDVPAYWRALDFVEEFSHEAFSQMLTSHFAHSFDGTAIGAVNVSGNPGYQRCLESGQISDATDRLVRASSQFEIYEAIRERSHLARAAVR